MMIINNNIFFLNYFYLNYKIYSGFLIFTLINNNSNYFSEIKKYYSGNKFFIFNVNNKILKKFFLNFNFLKMKNSIYTIFYYNFFLLFKKSFTFIKNNNFILKYLIFNKFFFQILFLKTIFNINFRKDILNSFFFFLNNFFLNFFKKIKLFLKIKFIKWK